VRRFLRGHFRSRPAQQPSTSGTSLHTARTTCVGLRGHFLRYGPHNMRQSQGHFLHTARTTCRRQRTLPSYVHNMRRSQDPSAHTTCVSLRTQHPPYGKIWAPARQPKRVRLHKGNGAHHQPQVAPTARHNDYTGNLPPPPVAHGTVLLFTDRARGSANWHRVMLSRRSVREARFNLSIR
jgi:hypothetical protein